MAADPKVLIVDDELPIRNLLARWLTRWGYRVQATADAIDALNAMTAEPADVIVCDINLPEYDGLWLAEQVHARWPGTAIVMATALDAPQTIRTSRKVGATAYVTKPFDSIVLRQAIDHASGRLRFRPSAERA